MSQDQFDALTRRLAATTSRRGVLKGLAAGALAAVTGTLLGHGQAEAFTWNVCCSYACSNGQVLAKCISCPGTCDCPIPPTGCALDWANPVAKCSACG